LLVIQVKIIGYPDMESVIPRVLASRTTMDTSEDLKMVTLLALIAPDTAPDLLESFEPRIERPGGTSWRYH